ncbi:MAG: hypothetical protein COU33_03790, partial [Candidatus Magasanikbacteria bacterium CG10_big_fil_rev_8_21_14_0_10_43_6]
RNLRPTMGFADDTERRGNTNDGKLGRSVRAPGEELGSPTPAGGRGPRARGAAYGHSGDPQGEHPQGGAYQPGELDRWGGPGCGACEQEELELALPLGPGAAGQEDEAPAPLLELPRGRGWRLVVLRGHRQGGGARAHRAGSGPDEGSGA